MNKRKLFFRVIVAIVVIGALVRYTSEQKNKKEQFYITGQTMGTIVYNVKYVANKAVVSKAEIDEVLINFNNSLSTYIPTSEVSELNKTGLLENPSKMFQEVFRSSFEVFQNSGGTFDPTVGPVINAWGFGPDKIVHAPDSATIDSLMQYVGFDAVEMTKSGAIKMNLGMQLSFSANAKGYAVDLVARTLENAGIIDYMVEIGGELRASGLNQKGEWWSIGIEDPTVAIDQQEIWAIAKLQNKAMATSGNYRNYYQAGDKIIAHTIDPRTGFNTQHNLLSATVFTWDCMSADAYATAMMVLGFEQSKVLAEKAGLDVFLIYQQEDGTIASYYSERLAEVLTLN